MNLINIGLSVVGLGDREGKSKLSKAKGAAGFGNLFFGLLKEESGIKLKKEHLSFNFSFDKFLNKKIKFDKKPRILVLLGIPSAVPRLKIPKNYGKRQDFVYRLGRKLGIKEEKYIDYQGLVNGNVLSRLDVRKVNPKFGKSEGWKLRNTVKISEQWPALPVFPFALTSKQTFNRRFSVFSGNQIRKIPVSEEKTDLQTKVAKVKISSVRLSLSNSLKENSKFISHLGRFLPKEVSKYLIGNKKSTNLQLKIARKWEKKFFLGKEAEKISSSISLSTSDSLTLKEQLKMTSDNSIESLKQKFQYEKNKPKTSPLFSQVLGYKVKSLDRAKNEISRINLSLGLKFRRGKSFNTKHVAVVRRKSYSFNKKKLKIKFKLETSRREKPFISGKFPVPERVEANKSFLPVHPSFKEPHKNILSEETKVFKPEVKNINGYSSGVSYDSSSLNDFSSYGNSHDPSDLGGKENSFSSSNQQLSNGGFHLSYTDRNVNLTVSTRGKILNLNLNFLSGIQIDPVTVRDIANIIESSGFIPGKIVLKGKKGRYIPITDSRADRLELKV